MRNLIVTVQRQLAEIRQCLFGIAVLFAFCMSTTALAENAIEETGLAIVVHKGSTVDNVSMAELRNIFMANQQFWADRSRIILLVRAPQSDERDYVLNRIYQMDEAQFRQYWIAKMFRAEIPRGPKIVFSSDMTLDLVVAIPGSISFMRADQVTDDVKIIKVDGLLPGEEGYPLR
jgi:hypothetical protein